MLCFYFFKQHAVLDPKQAQGPKGELLDSFQPSIFVHVGQHYFGMQDTQVKTFLEANNVRMDKEITLSKFLFTSQSHCLLILSAFVRFA